MGSEGGVKLDGGVYMLCAGMGDGEEVSRVEWGVSKEEKGFEAGGVTVSMTLTLALA